MHVSLIDTDTGWAWGIRMLSAVLKREGHQTRILLMNGVGNSYSPEELAQLEDMVAESSLIGISCLSGGSLRAQTILKHLRRTGKLLAWGGIHATLNPEECSSYADVVCVGEGEGMILDLVSKMEAGEDWRNIPNVAYRSDEKCVTNPLRPLVSDLDQLPLYDFSCEDEFQLNDGRIVKNTTLSHFAQQEIPFEGSRGCVFHCAYCCNGRLQEIYRGSGKYVRKHSIAECISRTTLLKQKYFKDGKYIFFVDDDFLDRTTPELEEFARDFPAKTGLPFECQVSPLRVNTERIALLARAGVWRIRMGVESGSERTKKQVYRRAMPNHAVEQASAVLAQFPRIVRAYYFIIGNPFEEPDDLLQTISLILRLPPPFFIQAFNLIFFPGSSLFNRALERGVIEGAHDSGYELHYRGGLKYKQHPWKRKNLYLNTLIFLMDGKVSKYRVGLLPRFLVRWLIAPPMLRLGERYLGLADAMISLKLAVLKTRTSLGGFVKRFLRDPRIVYNPAEYFRSKFASDQAKSVP